MGILTIVKVVSVQKRKTRIFLMDKKWYLELRDFFSEAGFSDFLKMNFKKEEAFLGFLGSVTKMGVKEKIVYSLVPPGYVSEAFWIPMG